MSNPLGTNLAIKEKLRGLIRVETSKIARHRVTATLYYRRMNQNSLKSTKVATVSFPFKIDPQHQGTNITYSSRAPKGSNLNESQIRHQKIDQELFLFKNQTISKNQKLTKVTTNLLGISYSVKGHEYFKISQIRYFGIEFEDDDFSYKIEINEENMSEGENLKLIPGMVSALALLLGAVGSILSTTTLYSKVKNLAQTPFFTAVKLQIITTIITQSALLKLVNNQPNLKSLILMYLASAALINLLFSLEWVFMLKTIRRNLKMKINLAFLVICVAGWSIAVWVHPRLLVEYSFFFACFLVIVDLLFMGKSLYLRTKVGWEVWLVVMIHVLIHPLCAHLFYYSGLLSTHYFGAAEILKKILMKDLRLMALMLAPFHLRFRFCWKWSRKTPRRTTKPVEVEISSQIEPIFINSLINGQPEFEFGDEKEGYSRNLPFRRANKNQIETKFLDSTNVLMNLNSRNPFFTNDFAAIGFFNFGSCLRYAVNGNKAWDLSIEHQAGQKKIFVDFVGESVWVNNQQRRDFVTYTYQSGNNQRLCLVSLGSRKVLTRPRLPAIRMVGKIVTSKGVAFTFFGMFNIPLFVVHNGDSIDLYFADYLREGCHTKVEGVEKFNSRVKERSERELLRQKEYAFFDNLMAVKQTWVDLAGYDRDVLNEAKYHQVLIVKVGERDFEARVVKSLDKITEGMFSALRIDHFFFVDKDTLALIMDSKIYLVNWKRSSVKRCIEIADLYSPMRYHGVRREKCFTSYWHDRVRGMIRFSVGTFKGGISYGNKDINRYLTDLDKIDVSYYYSGWFLDSEIIQNKILGNEVYARDHVEVGFGSSDSNSDDEFEMSGGMSSHETSRLLFGDSRSNQTYEHRKESIDGQNIPESDMI